MRASNIGHYPFILPSLLPSLSSFLTPLSFTCLSPFISLSLSLSLSLSNFRLSCLSLHYFLLFSLLVILSLSIISSTIYVSFYLLFPLRRFSTHSSSRFLTSLSSLPYHLILLQSLLHSLTCLFFSSFLLPPSHLFLSFLLLSLFLFFFLPSPPHSRPSVRYPSITLS